MNILVKAMELLESGNDQAGICLACGTEHDEVEPDAEGYECDNCGEFKVMSAEQIILTGVA